MRRSALLVVAMLSASTALAWQTTTDKQRELSQQYNQVNANGQIQTGSSMTNPPLGERKNPPAPAVTTRTEKPIQSMPSDNDSKPSNTQEKHRRTCVGWKNGVCTEWMQIY
jgi:type II secretory pathway pseudopilin PulG